MKLALTLALLLLGGCAQIFGLEETHGIGAGDDVDSGTVDLPTCDLELSCDADEICGRLIDLETGLGLIDAEMDHVPCEPGATELPCNLTVAAQVYPQLTAAPPARAATLDTCGRFVVDGVPSAGQIWSIEVAGNSYLTTETLVSAVDVSAGDHHELEAFAARTNYFVRIGVAPIAGQTPWVAITLSPGDAPVLGNAIRRDGVTLTPTSQIWYFADTDPSTRSMVDNRSSTGVNGAGVVMSPGGVLSTGCDRETLTSMAFVDRLVVLYMHCGS